MPHHDWSDKSFDWKSLDEAIAYCLTTWKRYGRIGSHGKEKYGTFRDHVYFWDGGIWSLFYPGHIWIKPGFWQFIYYTIDVNFTCKFTEYSGLYRIGIWWQAQVYNFAIQRACKKYPHIIDELVSSLDKYELVKPGIFGPVSGLEIHNKYWRKVE